MSNGIKFSRGKSFLVISLISLVAVAVVVLALRENLNSMLQALYRANFLYVPLAVLAYLSGLLIWALRWRVTLFSAGYRLSVRSIYLIIFSGIFVNNITPFTYAGGDPLARTYILKKTQNVSYSSGFATILAEYVFDLPLYISLVIFGFLISLKQMSFGYATFMLLLWLAFMVGWSFFFNRILSSSAGTKRIARLVSKLAKIFHRRLKTAKLERNIKEFYSSSQQIIKSRKVIFYVIILTIAVLVAVLTRLYFIFQALGYTPTLTMLFFAITLPVLVGMIPALPGGLGTVDAALVSVFLFSGVPFEIAVSAVLIERSITFVFSTAVGSAAFYYLGLKNFGSKKSRAKKPQ